MLLLLKWIFLTVILDLKEVGMFVFSSFRCSVLEAMKSGLKLIRDAVENTAVDCSMESAVQNIKTLRASTSAGISWQ